MATYTQVEAACYQLPDIGKSESFPSKSFKKLLRTAKPDPQRTSNAVKCDLSESCDQVEVSLLRCPPTYSINFISQRTIERILVRLRNNKFIVVSISETPKFTESIVIIRKKTSHSERKQSTFLSPYLLHSCYSPHVTRARYVI